MAAAVACLPLCLFLEAHNMADMCFVIVSTSSSLLAYKDLLAPPLTHPPFLPKQQNALKITLAWNQDCYNYITEQLIGKQRGLSKIINLLLDSPFDDDGCMEYLFLEKRH